MLERPSVKFCAVANNICRNQAFATAQGIAVSLSAEAGYGRHLDHVSATDLSQVMKVKEISSRSIYATIFYLRLTNY